MQSNNSSGNSSGKPAHNHQPHRPHKNEDHKSPKTLSGTIKTNGKGKGFVTLPGSKDSIVIEPEFVNKALNGDEVGNYSSTNNHVQ